MARQPAPPNPNRRTHRPRNHRSNAAPRNKLVPPAPATEGNEAVMGKKSRRKKVNPARPPRPVIMPVARPFEGIPGEANLVAMREIIPAATLPATTTSEYGDRAFTFATLLPNAVPALVRPDGEILVALQTRSHTADAGHDVAVALQAALDLASRVEAGEAEPGGITVDVREAAPKLQDMVATTGDIKVEKDFGYWLAAGADEDEDVHAAIEESARSLIPTAAVPDVEATFWHDMGRQYVRWVRTEDESALFTALARLQAREELTLGNDSHFIGAFRACGLTIPVFEFPNGVDPNSLADKVQDLQAKVESVLGNKEPLIDDERRIRAGLVSRQVSLR